MINYNYSVDVFKHVLEGLKINGLKSGLVILSVAIGVTTLILGLTFSTTLSKSLVWQFENLGSNTVTVSSFLPLSEQLKGNKAVINHDEFEIIKRELSDITSNITPLIKVPQAHVQIADKSANPSIVGSTYSYMQMRNRFVEEGRFINDADNQLRRRSVVVGATVLEQLEVKKAIGRYIKINHEWFVIVGVLASKGSFFGVDLDDIVIMPYETAHSLLGNGVDQDILIQMTVNDVSKLEHLRQSVTNILRTTHQLSVNQDNDFKIETTDELLGTFNSVLKIVAATLISVVGLSLVVASVGMVNIFLLSINERINEIGLFMALGAGRKFISSLFIIESSVLTTVGGLLGLFLGYLLAILLSWLLPAKYVIEFPFITGLYTTLFCFVLGVIVSILPAAKACTLSPSRALAK
jgi:putative ABC transport system permease protein